MKIRRSAIFILICLLAVLLVATACGDRDKDTDSEHSDYVVLDEVPDWSGDESKPYVEINGNVPDFDEGIIEQAREAADTETSETDSDRFEVFEELDKRGRCGSAVACVGLETMPDGERGSIGMVKPSGWQLDKYDFIDNGGFLYNRCHLIGWQLTGQNEEERNLITGTRYMNTQGMLPFENKVAEYVRRTGNHVLYRATPLFRGKELVARGVQLEVYSLEDDGAGLSFNVYCYNVQPGVKIDYKTGKNELDETTLPAAIAAGEKLTDDEADNGGGTESEAGDASKTDEDKTDEADNDISGGEYPELDVPEGVTYILNTNTMRFHKTDCKGARSIREHNREWFYGTRDEAIDAGYVPCGMCEP